MLTTLADVAVDLSLPDPATTLMDVFKPLPDTGTVTVHTLPAQADARDTLTARLDPMPQVPVASAVAFSKAHVSAWAAATISKVDVMYARATSKPYAFTRPVEPPERAETKTPTRRLATLKEPPTA